VCLVASRRPVAGDCGVVRNLEAGVAGVVDEATIRTLAVELNQEQTALLALELTVSLRRP